MSKFSENMVLLNWINYSAVVFFGAEVMGFFTEVKRDKKP